MSTGSALPGYDPQAAPYVAHILARFALKKMLDAGLLSKDELQAFCDEKVASILQHPGSDNQLNREVGAALRATIEAMTK